MPRLFFGLEIPAAIRQNLLRIKAPVDGARWQGADQLHITLLFLGRTEEERIVTLCDAARRIPAEPFELAAVGLGCFGQARSPRNLWAGVQPAAPVAGLHGALKGQMQSLGFFFDSRVFRPHITLARFRRQSGSVERVLADHGESVFGQCPVSQFVLFESKPGASGSVYTALERFPLQGAD